MRCTTSFETGQIRYREFVVILVVGQIIWIDMCQFGFSQIGDAKFSKDVVDNGCSEFDGRMSGHGPGGFKPRKHKGIDIFLEGDAMLEAEADGDGKTVHEASECRTFLVHIDKDFAQRAIGIFTGSEVNIILIDRCLLGVSASS